MSLAPEAVRASSLGGANELSPEKAHVAAARRVNAVVGSFAVARSS